MINGVLYLFSGNLNRSIPIITIIPDTVFKLKSTLLPHNETQFEKLGLESRDSSNITLTASSTATSLITYFKLPVTNLSRLAIPEIAKPTESPVVKPLKKQSW